MGSSTGLAYPVRTSFIGFICLIVLVLGGGAIYQWQALRRNEHLNPMPGRLVDVGGYRLHIVCTGEGSPTVVLESGLGATWLAWYRVQPLIAQFTRVCSYDRAGMGWSDPSSSPRTARVIAQELHLLLQNAGVGGPYVLVGHSLGGMYVRLFASLHRNVTSGLVLVDSAVPHQYERLPQAITTYSNHFLRVQTWKEDTMVFGVPRLMGWCGDGPAAIRSELRTVDCRVGPWKEHLAEYHAFDESSDEIVKVGPLGSLPLVVISQDSGTGSTWSVLQASLTQLSTDSCRIVAEGSGHDIPSERPELIAGVVRRLVEQSRANRETPVRITTDLFTQFDCVR